MGGVVGWRTIPNWLALSYNLQEARAEDSVSDGMLCCAAAMMLDGETGEIAHKQLRIYAAQRLSGEVPPPKENGKDKNAYRDAAISGGQSPGDLALRRRLRPVNR